MRRKTLVLLGTAIFVLITAGLVCAQSPIVDGLSTCTDINCQSARVQGMVLSKGAVAANFTFNVYAEAGECLRFDVIAQTGIDFETVVIAPNGSVYRNDDGSPSCLTCPLVKIDPAPNTGYYAVRLAHYGGLAYSGTLFLQYGRYPTGNPNCSTPTPPLTFADGDAYEAAKAAKNP